MTPKVCVVMSSYNHARYVADAIRSVLDQSFGDFEFLIDDDGSTDGSADIIRAFNDPRIQFTAHTDNRGSAERRNKLIAKSDAEYIAVQNSDDIWATDKLAHQVDVMDRDRTLGALFGRASTIGSDGEMLDREPALFAEENRSQGRWLRRFFVASNCLCHPSSLVRRSCHSEVGLYDSRFRQLPDMEMWVRLVKRHPIAVCERSLVSFRLHDQSTSGSERPGNMTRMLNEQNFIAERMFDDVPPDILRDGFGDHFVVSEPPTDWHWDIEKALLYFSVPTKFAALYKPIGLRRLHALLASPDHRPILLNDYRIDHFALHRISAETATFQAMSAPGVIAALEAANRSLRHDHAVLASECEATMQHARNLEKELATLRTSTSWRLTAPLRAVSGRLGRSKG